MIGPDFYWPGACSFRLKIRYFISNLPWKIVSQIDAQRQAFAPRAPRKHARLFRHRGLETGRGKEIRHQILPTRACWDIDIAGCVDLRQIGVNADWIAPFLDATRGIEQQTADTDNGLVGADEMFPGAIVDRRLRHTHGSILDLDAGEAGPVFAHAFVILAEPAIPAGSEQTVLFRPVARVVEAENLDDRRAIDGSVAMDGNEGRGVLVIGRYAGKWPLDGYRLAIADG